MSRVLRSQRLRFQAYHLGAIDDRFHRLERLEFLNIVQFVRLVISGNLEGLFPVLSLR